MNEKRKRKIRVGKIYETKSFSGPQVFVRATRLDDRGFGFFGDIARKSDLISLIESGVPFDIKRDWPDKCETFVFLFHVVREVRNFKNISDDDKSAEKKPRRRKVRSFPHHNKKNGKRNG